MAHYAKVENGFVTQVIVADQAFIDSGVVGDPSSWIQTSYNTRGNVHYGPDGLPDGGVALRGNYASIGMIYNSELDVFTAPKPYPSWTLDQSDYLWKAPTAYPTDGKYYKWDEEQLDWIEVVQ